MLHRADFQKITLKILIATVLIHGNAAHSAAPPGVKYKQELGTIPKATTAPPSLGLAQPATEQFKCERLMIYRGEVINCDSNIRQDAERLRPILSSVPTALEELNTYQRNRRWVRNLAYIGTAGVLIAVASRLIPGNKDAPIISARELTFIGGLGISGGSLLYGLSFLRTNEAHLGSAVDHYNKANPKDQIELQFSTGISF